MNLDLNKCVTCKGWSLSIDAIATLTAVATLMFVAAVIKIYIYNGERFDGVADEVADIVGGDGEAARTKSKDQYDRIHRFERVYQRIVPKIKILVTFSQLVAGLGFTLDFTFPLRFQQFCSLAGLFNVNLVNMAPVKC